jgi:hypothetical protein
MEEMVQTRNFKPSFRGASKASEPGIHNPRREYGFSACASGRQLPTEGRIPE